MFRLFGNANLTATQKTGFVFLLIFGVLALGLAGVQMRNSIFGPFLAPVAEDTSRVAAQASLDETIRLQRIDTDHDGITDYQETHFYNTSPYLPDTDSDGKKDKEEIDAGTDPLCAQGKTCGALTDTFTATEKTVIGSPIQATVGLTDVIAGSDGLSEAGSDIISLLDDPKALREAILKSGKISKEELEKIDDVTLLNLSKNILSSSAETSVGDE